MVTDGAGGVDLELGLRSTLPHAIGEHSLRGGATADVPEANEEHGKGLRLCHGRDRGG